MFSRMLARVTFPLAAANVMNQAARTVMAIVGPVLAVELGLSAVELGVLAACLFAGYAVVQLPLGVALDAFGPRRVQAVLMSLAAVGFAIFALSPGFGGLVLARIVPTLGDEDVSPLNALLELPDDDLWDIVIGRSNDYDPQHARIVARLRAA